MENFFKLNDQNKSRYRLSSVISYHWYNVSNRNKWVISLILEGQKGSDSCYYYEEDILKNDLEFLDSIYGVIDKDSYKKQVSLDELV